MKQWKQVFLTLGLFIFFFDTAVLQAKSKEGKQKIENKKTDKSKKTEIKQHEDNTKTSKEDTTKAKANGKTNSKRDWSTEAGDAIEIGSKSVVEDVKGLFGEIGGL